MNVMDPGRQKPWSSFAAAIRKASRAAQTQPRYHGMAASAVHAVIRRRLRPGDAIGGGKRHSSSCFLKVTCLHCFLNRVRVHQVYLLRR